MALRWVNLDESGPITKMNMLVHAVYGAGKTHFLGDALHALQAEGPIAYVYFDDDDGKLSIRNLGLAKRGIAIGDHKEFAEFLAEAPKMGLKAAGFDNLRKLSDLNTRHLVGDRLPKTGDAKTNEWSEIHFRAQNLFNQLRYVADIVLCTCPSDKYTSTVTGETTISPDMPGMQSRIVTGCFDFVGYIDAKLMGPGRVRRKLMLTPNSLVTTRQRLPRPITEDIEIPDGGGGWANFMGAVQKAMGGAK